MSKIKANIFSTELMNILVIEYDVIDNLKDIVKDIIIHNPKLKIWFIEYEYVGGKPFYIITYSKDYQLNLSVLDNWKEAEKTWENEEIYN